MSNVGSGGGAPAAGSAAPAAASSAAVEEQPEKVEEAKEEESDEDMVRGVVRLSAFSSNMFFILSRVSDFSINLLDYLQSENFVFVACPIWNFKGAHPSSMPVFRVQAIRKNWDIGRDYVANKHQLVYYNPI